MVMSGVILSSPSFVNAAYSEQLDACLVLVKNPDHNPCGDFALNRDRVEYGDHNNYTFSGISLIRPSLFANFTDQQDAFPLRDVLRPAIVIGSSGRHSLYWQLV